ncbi:MAG: AAA family ATPase [Alphaproteobacteria bacterium]|nr:AAA family ATPase [Alphaproteobacteria bacterium]
MTAYLEKNGYSVHSGGGGKTSDLKPQKEFPIEFLDEEYIIKKAIAWLEDEAPIAEEGNGGNETTFKIACELSNRGTSEGKALELMLEHWNENKADPPWDPEELQSVIRNAYKYNKGGLGSKHPRMIFNPVEIKPDRNGEHQNRFAPISWEDIDKLPRKAPLIKGLLDCGGTSVVFGPSNCGKSFFVLDMALHVALGKLWSSRKICQGAVVYIAAEGGLGIRERLEALYKHYKINKKPPLYIIPISPDFCNSSKDVEEIIAAISGLYNVKLIVIDTLSRAMAGGNENSPDDMGAFIRNFEKLKDGTGAHILIIHHSGKDNARGARGHSSLKCAIDTEIEITKNGDKDEQIVTAEIKKQRDGRTDVKFSFVPKEVQLGQDEDGEWLSSCVLIPVEGAGRNVKKLSGQKGRALNILHYCIEKEGKERTVKKGSPPVMCVKIEEFRDALKNGNISNADNPDSTRRIIGRLINDLNELGLSDTYGDHIWLAEKPGQTGSSNLHQADGQDKPYKGCPLSLDCLN